MTSFNIVLDVFSLNDAGLTFEKISKSVNIEIYIWALTVATLTSAFTKPSCSTTHTPTSTTKTKNPATLLFHSLNKKSIAFFSAPEIP